MGTVSPSAGTGRVLQVNVSGGGIPKRPIDRASVGRFGLSGDTQNETTVHGGPHKAVCLLAVEAIERMQSEGHPIEPGSAGENLTTSGVEWSLLPVGTRARIGQSLELELASPAMPCAKQLKNFRDGRFSRMSIDLHPSDSRMYARVLADGDVKPGDAITVLPPAADSRARTELILKSLDRAETKSSLAAWRAALDSGFDVRILDEGELAAAASPEIRGFAFNHASGLARMPQLIDIATRFFDQHGRGGSLVTETEPWPDAVPDVTLDVFAADPDRMADATIPMGLTLRPIRAADGATVTGIHAATGSVGVGEDQRGPWAAVYSKLAAHPHRVVLLAELHGQPAAAASVHVAGKVGWMRGASVVPSARGLGIQRALIRERARIAAERGCDVVGAWAKPHGHSARNLELMGFTRVGTRRHFSYAPAASAVPGVETVPIVDAVAGGVAVPSR